jgi:DNA-directed RNA polymerase specialized sigma24 family protein
MARSDQTTMGGEGEAFETTHWSQIQDAQRCNGPSKREIIARLLARYWKPVYCYLKRKGYDNESAKDLTQGFFHEVVLKRDLIQHCDEAKGRFRTFLLTALDHYLVSAHRAEEAEMRHPSKGAVSLETFDESSFPAMSAEMKPDEAFVYVWASELVDGVLAEVEQQCLQDGKAAYWDIFRARVLEPIMEGTEPKPLSKLCKQFSIESETKASNMIVTVKRRFQMAIRRRVSLHVHSAEEVTQEICDLMRILSKARAS